MAKYRKLRDRDGSALLALPPEFLQFLGWTTGETLAMTLHEDGIFVQKPEILKKKEEQKIDIQMKEKTITKKEETKWTPSWRKPSNIYQQTKSTDQKSQLDKEWTSTHSTNLQTQSEQEAS